MLKSSLLMQKLPSAVTNVMSNADVLVSEICQNLLFVSSSVNIIVSVNWARVSSTLESG